MLIYSKVTKEISVPLPEYKTNNQAELAACCIALESLKEPCEVILHTDSSYVENGITQWIIGWKRRGWKTSNKHDVKNKDLWVRLDGLTRLHKVEFKWVKAHADNELNNLADTLAVQASSSICRRG